MSGVACDRSVDSTLSLLRHGYAFISRRCEQLGTDAFETRLLGRRTICCRGAEAARLFYDPERMQRKDAMPRPIRKTLTGTGGVQGLDATPHRRRKAMFLAMMTPDRVAALADRFEVEWRTRARQWQVGTRVTLFDELQLILCRAVCEWSGVPLPDEDVARRTSDLAAMIDAGPGLRHLRARRARRRSERWAAELVRRVRAGALDAYPAFALSVIATHRDENGSLLPERVAAVELLNVWRPTVAISTFITFAALALHDYPQVRQQLRQDDADDLANFVDEVRRFYPFFPFAAARACKAFVWNGYRFERGRRVLLDIYGTNHDPAAWISPHEFRPARFTGNVTNRYSFLPQGGGTFDVHHRCAGEWVTVEIMKRAVAILLHELSYDVPPQDLRVKLSRMPTLPASRFVIEVTGRMGDASARGRQAANRGETVPRQRRNG